MNTGLYKENESCKIVRSADQSNVKKNESRIEIISRHEQCIHIQEEKEVSKITNYKKLEQTVEKLKLNNGLEKDPLGVSMF